MILDTKAGFLNFSGVCPRPCLEIREIRLQGGAGSPFGGTETMSILIIVNC